MLLAACVGPWRTRTVPAQVLQGQWMGTYECGGTTRALTLTIDPWPGELPVQADVRVDVFPVGDHPAGAPGTFKARGRFEGRNGKLEPTEWITQPPAGRMVGLTGRFLSDGKVFTGASEGQVFAGTVDGDGCRSFSVRRLPTRERVRAIAFAGDAIHALDGDGRVLVWDGQAAEAPARELPRASALADDGSVVLVVTPEKTGGHRAEVWAVTAAKRLHTRPFADGIDGVLSVARGAVALRLDIHYPHFRNEGEPQVLPPRWRDVVWTFASETVTEVGHDRCVQSVLSNDGGRLACVGVWETLSWFEPATGRFSERGLAPDWFTPDREPRPSHIRAQHQPPDYLVQSLRIDPKGDQIYVAYVGIGAHKDWRLERWSPLPTPDGETPTLLVSADETERADLLAISPDGGLAVLASGGWLAVRRAPRYAPERLPADYPTAAAISPDGARIATGHEDGRLRLWDAASGRLLATTVRP